MTAREKALEKHIDEITLALAYLTDATEALVLLAIGAKKARGPATVDGVASAVLWTARRLQEAANGALDLTDTIAHPLADEVAEAAE